MRILFEHTLAPLSTADCCCCCYSW